MMADAWPMSRFSSEIKTRFKRPFIWILLESRVTRTTGVPLQASDARDSRAAVGVIFSGFASRFISWRFIVETNQNCAILAHC